MKQRYYTGFIKIRQKKCRQPQFGTFCQITPPLISLNSLSNAVLYKAKFGVVEVFCLNFIQLLCTSTLIPSHQELLAQNGSSQVKCEHNTHTHTHVHCARMGKSTRAPHLSAQRC